MLYLMHIAYSLNHCNRLSRLREYADEKSNLKNRKCLSHKRVRLANLSEKIVMLLNKIIKFNNV